MSSKPSTQQRQVRRRSGARMILDEARVAHQASRQLLPLLELLEEPEGEGEGPLDELRELLELLIEGQRHQMMAIEDLTRQVEALREGRPLRRSAAASAGSRPHDSSAVSISET